ncbi:M20 metallopeptidase family protein [Lentibacillus salinarum]|uniref:M20 family metallopeptidase n=1 Tax=Lentibacillus salinarum TaxID=446820 RepID=A0ABW3ZU66_9BACI
MRIDEMTEEIQTEMVKIRRHLHKNPELSMKEYNTTNLVMDVLKDTAIDLQKLKGDTGVVGVLRGKGEGPTLGLRGDMDALPIKEATGLAFSSDKEGVMHACGHDLHTSVLLGTALVLDKKRDQLNGNIKFIFQPGEEVMQGANYVIDQGVLDAEPKVDKIICLHTWPQVDAGKIGVRKGPIMAATDAFDIRVDGSGGHAAHPHKSIDPIPVAGQIVSGLQSIISRRISPLDSAVVTLGQIHGGEANNIMASEVRLSGTVRSLDPEVRNHIKNNIAEISENIAKAHDTQAEVTFHLGSPPVINDESLVDIMDTAVRKELGDDNLVYLPEPSLGGEDFSFYLEHVDGMLFRIGTKNDQEQSTRSLHNPGIIFDEKAIPAGITAMSSFAVEFLK